MHVLLDYKRHNSVQSFMERNRMLCREGYGWHYNGRSLFSFISKHKMKVRRDGHKWSTIKWTSNGHGRSSVIFLASRKWKTKMKSSPSRYQRLDLGTVPNTHKITKQPCHKNSKVEERPLLGGDLGGVLRVKRKEIQECRPLGTRHLLFPSSFSPRAVTTQLS